MSFRNTPFGPVFHDENALAALDSVFNECKEKGVKVFFLVDENTHEKCLVRLLPELPSLGEYELLEIPPGEDSKSIEVVAQLWSALAELGANRHSLLVNVGGGMITDLGGFVASCYMRGIHFAQVPTSLLGMVDASIGGKTGVDVSGIKNLAGAFATSIGVFLIPDFIETLPERELKAGFAEMLKHGLIRSATHFVELTEVGYNGLNQRPDLIRASMSIKLDVVEADPNESTIRKELNFGHTLGHALESHFLQKGGDEVLLHGEAVAHGMWLEVEISALLGYLDRNTAADIQAQLDRYFGRLEMTESEWNLVTSWLKYDKKNKDESPRFILLKDLGEAIVDCSVDLDLLHQAFSNWQNLNR